MVTVWDVKTGQMVGQPFMRSNQGITGANIVAKRNDWIQKLGSGRNPFDAKTLEELRRNDIGNLD